MGKCVCYQETAGCSPVQRLVRLLSKPSVCSEFPGHLGGTAGAAALADVAVADGFQLPYRTASCDAVLCIAVLHHMSSPARRVRLLQELMRVLRPGVALTCRWSTPGRAAGRHTHALEVCAFKR